MPPARVLIASLAGIVVGAGLFWLVAQYTDIESAWRLVLHADASSLAGTVVCAFAFAVVKAVRWGWLLQHIQQVGTTRLLAAVFAGSAVNYGVPHAGELVRAWMIASTDGVKHAAVLASIGVERIFDFVAVLVVGLVAIRLAGTELQTINAYMWALAGLIVLLLAVVLPFLLWPSKALGLLAKMLSMAGPIAGPWILKHVAHGQVGLGALQSAPMIVIALIASVVQWALMAGCAWFSLSAVGIHPNAALASIVVVLLVVGLTLPAAPGHIGTTQAAFLLAALPFGLSATEAIAGSLAYNVLVPLTFLIPGIAALVRHYLRKRVRRHTPTAVDPTMIVGRDLN